MSRAVNRVPAEEMAMAERCLLDARTVVRTVPRMAAREAYLAALHAAHARIAAAGRAVPTTHKGVNIVLGELYRGSEMKAQAVLSALETWKLAADYGRGDAASVAEAEAAIDEAELFIAPMAADLGAEALRGDGDAAALAALRRMADPEP